MTTVERERGGTGTARRRRSPWYALLVAASLALVMVVNPTAGASAPAVHGGDLGEEFTQGSVRVPGGSTVNYVVGGSGPPVVLLHGWPETWWSWREVMPQLAEDYTVIAFDLPGLGDSTAPNARYDKRTIARLLRHAVRKLGFRDQVHLVGHDLGGLVAYPYARQFPGEVASVVVIETPLSGFGLEGAYGRSWHFGFNMTAAPVPEQILDDDDVAVYLGWLFDRAVHPDRIDQQTFFAAYADPARRSAGFEYYRAFPDDATYNQAAAAVPVTVPVLGMGAETVFGPLVAASLENVATDVRGVVVPDTGHWIPEERPEFVVDCLRLFLDPAPAAGPVPPDLANCVR